MSTDQITGPWRISLAICKKTFSVSSLLQDPLSRACFGLPHFFKRQNTSKNASIEQNQSGDNQKLAFRSGSCVAAAMSMFAEPLSMPSAYCETRKRSCVGVHDTGAQCALHTCS